MSNPGFGGARNPDIQKIEVSRIALACAGVTAQLWFRGRLHVSPSQQPPEIRSFEEMSIADWTATFRDSVSDLPRVLGNGASYPVASERLRALVKGGLVKLTDVRDNPGEACNSWTLIVVSC